VEQKRESVHKKKMCSHFENRLLKVCEIVLMVAQGYVFCSDFEKSCKKCILASAAPLPSPFSVTDALDELDSPHPFHDPFEVLHKRKQSPPSPIEIDSSDEEPEKTHSDIPVKKEQKEKNAVVDVKKRKAQTKSWLFDVNSTEGQRQDRKKIPGKSTWVDDIEENDLITKSGEELSNLEPVIKARRLEASQKNVTEQEERGNNTEDGEEDDAKDQVNFFFKHS